LIFNGITRGELRPYPFYQSTMLKVQCSMAGKVKIRVYNISWKKVATSLDEELKAGIYEVSFNVRHGGSSTNLPSGVYLYNLETDNFTETKKMTILK